MLFTAAQNANCVSYFSYLPSARCYVSFSLLYLSITWACSSRGSLRTRNVSMRIHVRRYAPAVRVPSFPTITMNYHKSPLHVERCGCSFVKQPRVKSIRVPLSRSMLLNRYHFSAISREWADRSAILIQKMNWFTSNVVRVRRWLREHCRFRQKWKM